jgi:hypothetical protein
MEKADFLLNPPLKIDVFKTPVTIANTGYRKGLSQKPGRCR